MRPSHALRSATVIALALALTLAGCSAGTTASSSDNASSSASITTASLMASDADSTTASDEPIASAPGRSDQTIEVTLKGGTGKASVESPAKIVVADDGSMTATIVWSSPNYDQMIVGGVRYLPVNTSGNSTFEIPVAALDEDIAVQAETTAMSEPHLIDYTLRYDSSTLG